MHKVKRLNYMIKNMTVITSTIIADHLVYLLPLSQCLAKMIAPSQLDRKEIQGLCLPSLNLQRCSRLIYDVWKVNQTK